MKKGSNNFRFGKKTKIPKHQVTISIKPKLELLLLKWANSQAIFNQYDQPNRSKAIETLIERYCTE